MIVLRAEKNFIKGSRTFGLYSGKFVIQNNQLNELRH